MSTHEVPIACDKSGSSNASPACHSCDDGHCTRQTHTQWTSVFRYFIHRYQLDIWRPWFKKKDGEIDGQRVRGAPSLASHTPQMQAKGVWCSLVHRVVLVEFNY